MSNNSENTKPKMPTWVKSMLSFFLKAVLTVLVLWILLTWVIGVYVCHDNSAYPMIKDGDLCLTYKLSELKQGDAIVYKKDDGKIGFGRIVALSGSEVSFQNDKVLINGYEYFDNTVYPTSAEGTDYPHTVSEGHIFVLNDYRSDMSDSRTFGDVSLEDVQGKIVFIMRRRGL